MRLKQLETLIESSKKHALFEGVKIGKKEIEETLNNSADFQMGIEYEILMPLNGSVDDATTFIEDNNITNIKEVKPEHDRMTEIITNVMPIPTGINHIKNFFEKAQANNITFPSTAGLHISISHKHHDKKDINFTKFLVLLSGDYLHSLFPERKYVKNIETIMRDTLTKYNKSTSVKDIEQHIEDEFEEGDDGEVKYITAKISDYINMNGRIELRFFGGEDYNKQFNEIRWQVLRAVYILAIAYEPDMFRKEYLKILYSYTKRKALPLDYDLSDTNPEKAYDMLSTYNDDRLTNIVALSPHYSYLYSTNILKGRFKKGENSIAQRPDFSYLYAKEVINGRFEKGEATIATSVGYSVMYAKNVIKGRFEKGETEIAKTASDSYIYAMEVLEGRFEKGEDSISQDGEYSYRYAKKVLHSRFELGEDAISKLPMISYYYAKNVLRDKFEKGEDAIADTASYSYKYANDVLKGRFEKGEDVIANDGYFSFLYAIEVLKGRFEKGEPNMSDELNDKEREEYLELTGIQL